MLGINAKEVQELCTKYANIGLYIEIDLDRYGMILRGYWDLTLNKVDLYNYNKSYSYFMLENMTDEVSLDYMIDEFKEEFARYLKDLKERGK